MSARSSSRRRTRSLKFENLLKREVMAADMLPLQNPDLAQDVNADQQVTPLDALMVINQLARNGRATEGETQLASSSAAFIDRFFDVNGDGLISAADALNVINFIAREVGEPLLSAEAEPSSVVLNGAKAPGVGTTYKAVLNNAETINQSENLLTASDVKTLLDRAERVSSSNDAIIAVVDRSGRILGVRIESDVKAAYQGRPKELAFAIDGAVAKARTAAFFSSNQAPLTSRTIRFISQSTITQREVESSPIATDPRYQGPGYVAPIGVGGHFPPQTAFTPQVDLFGIEEQSRDSSLNAGADGVKGTGDDFSLVNRFNADTDYAPTITDQFFATFPESYGFVSGVAPELQSRGIATLPGGIPLYKAVVDAKGNPVKSPVSASVNLVGGIGVFFPGADGYATTEQGFVHSSLRGGIAQTEASRINASKVLEAEFIALAAASGQNKLVGPSAFVRDLSFVNKDLPALPRFVSLIGRIDLVGITLEIYGPTPTQANPLPGIDQLIALGKTLKRGAIKGNDMPVNTGGDKFLDGQSVPEGWLIAPHDSSMTGGLKAADVEKIIRAGVQSALQTRAAIRLDVDGGFRPGARTRMVLSVADSRGELLGVYRMADATIFSIDVSIAKARNTAYYADASDLQPTDRIDFNDDGNFNVAAQDSVPKGTALTNRTFRFLVEPRYPTGIELPKDSAKGLVNDATKRLRDQKPSAAKQIGPESILQMPGINPLTAENLVNDNPLPRSIYADPDSATVLSFASFVPGRNFRDPGDGNQVKIHGTNQVQPLANQNGIVFFPGSTALYINGQANRLRGGFGVSGDGVDQDDVVTASGQVGYEPPQSIRIDSYLVGGVRLPYQKFNRNPGGP